MSDGVRRRHFFLSPDQHYILKTTTLAELRALRRMLPAYLEHLRDGRKKGQSSLLPRYCAIFELRRRHARPLHFVVVRPAPRTVPHRAAPRRAAPHRTAPSAPSAPSAAGPPLTRARRGVADD